MYLKEGQKLIVLMLDGLNFSLGTNNSFFSKYYNPFFYNLFYNNRSLVLERKKFVNPVHTFYSGQEIMNHRFLVKDLFLKNQLINSKLIQKISDQLAKSCGRLWLVADNIKLLNLVIQDINRSTIHKIGIISALPQNNLKGHLKKDYQFIELNKFGQTKQKLIETNDIFLLLIDSQNINRFSNLIKNNSLRFNRFIVLTDEQNEGFFESVKSNNTKKDFREILLQNNIKLIEIEINTLSDWQIPNVSQIVLISVNPAYLDLELPHRLTQERLKKIDNFIFQIYNDTSTRILITAKYGQRYLYNPDLAELLPFIIDEKKLPKQNFKSPLEKYLKDNCSTADIAPTILDMLEIARPREVTGNSMLPNLFPEYYIGNHSDLGHRIPAASRKSMFE